MQPDTFGYEPQPEKNLFKSLLLKYISHWPMFLVLLVICGTAAILFMKYKVPVYEVKATIIVTDQQKGTDDSKMIESLDVFRSKTIVDNEMEVLRSQTVAQDVVRNLNLYAPISEKRMLNHTAYFTSPVEIVAKYPDSLQPAKQIPFTVLSGNNKVLLDGRQHAVDEWFNSPYGLLKFIANPNYKPADNRTSTFSFSLIPVNYVAENLVSGLSIVSSDKLSTVVNISLKDNIPQRGKKILNELIAVYNKATVEDKNLLAANTLSFVEERLRHVVQELDSIEGNMQRFKTQNKIVDINTQGRMYLENVGQNDQKIGDISMQLAILNQVETYVTGKGDKGGIVPSTLGLSDPVLTGLLDKLYNTELEYEKFRKIAPENNPVLLSLSDQINKIKPSILENIKNERRGLTAGKNDISATNSKYSAILNTIPSKERELLEISRQQSIKNNIYTFLLQKREEAAISYASAVANSRLVDSAQTSRLPVSPDKIIVYAIALIAALGSGIGYLTIKEFFDTNVNSREEIEKHTRIPVIAELVRNNTNVPVVMNEDNHSMIAEQFRQLRTSLGYLGIHSRQKKILVTSTTSGEGKSFIAANLAISLALANKKVALVDMDLRRPTLASILDITSEVGVSQYLRGEIEIESIIKRSGNHKNLFVLPAGSLPNNPSELLLSIRMQKMISYLESAFDYIIIDTPPVKPVTDACILSPLCDATLYIIRQGVTPRAFVQKLDKYNRAEGLKNMAIVLNAMKRKDIGNYGNEYTDNYQKRGAKKNNFLRKKLGNTI